MKGLAPRTSFFFPFYSSMSSLLFFIFYRGVKRGHLYNHIALAADALVHIDSEEGKATGTVSLLFCSAVMSSNAHHASPNPTALTSSSTMAIAASLSRPAHRARKFVCASWTPKATKAAQSRRSQPPNSAWRSSPHPQHPSAWRLGA